jgi:hypothetical protein
MLKRKGAKRLVLDTGYWMNAHRAWGKAQGDPSEMLNREGRKGCSFPNRDPGEINSASQFHRVGPIGSSGPTGQASDSKNIRIGWAEKKEKLIGFTPTE